MSTPVSSRRAAWGSRIAVIAVTLIPLAFAGLFVGSLSQADSSLDRIPAAVVNSDELIMQTAADGTETPIFAGRQLVTELTGAGSAGFDWVITNAEDAEDALATGEVYAVLTVPDNFSESILSLQSDTPRQAEISIRTDDAHSYLSGAVAQSVGDSMVSAFGREITSQYIAGIYSSIGEFGESLGTAASGASDLASGARSLGSGLDSIATGAATAQTGAVGVADGVAGYTSGVASLSGGLSQLRAAAGGLTGISDGVDAFTGGVSQLAAGIAGANAQLNDADETNDDAARASLSALSGQLSQTAAGGGTLASNARGGIQGIQGGIASSANGASTLAAGGGDLTTGAGSIAGAIGSLSTGVADASGGAAELATGAADLAEGLRQGADAVPPMEGDAGTEAASVVAEPVTLAVDRDNEVTSIGQIVATFFVPLGLWIGALAAFLVLRPVSRVALASTAGTGRLVGATLLRAFGITIAQALLLVALLHTALGVDWALLPATLGLSVLMALAFTAFHYLLTVGLGRGGLVISLLVLAVQVTATGGLYPVQLIAEPFRAISPLLPLTYGVSGMQAIIAGGGAGAVVSAALVLVGFGLLSILGAVLVVRSIRRSRSLGLLAVPV
ncbi:putative membrane protein [Marisediminicola sp. UYEF4]|uniref:YhgE/Pip family protein n=1 Tax=Marisediminicola sp. UYEF4 TaxID=1756384 RepID=UPI003394AF5E